MKKAMLTGAILGLTTAVLFAGESKANLIKYGIFAPQTIQEYKAISLQNSLNRYVLKVVETKPQGARPGEFQIRLREPSVYYSFSRPLYSFFNLTVGKQSLRELSPNFEAIEIWNKETSAGFTMPVNFSGSQYKLTFYMKDKSPLLWCSVEAPEQVKTAMKVALDVIPSALIPGQWNKYRRYAQTAGRKMTAGPRVQTFSPEDKYMILADEDLVPGAKYPNATGPCFITWNPQGMTSVSINDLANYQSCVTFVADPKIEVGLWESNKKQSMDDFMKYFQEYLAQVIE